MTVDDYEIVRYRPELAKTIARLHAVQMPEMDADMSARYLEWKYSTNPYIKEPLIYVALHKGEAVAMRGFYGTCWEAGDSRFIVPCAGDLVVAADHQNRGLIARIMKMAFADFPAMGFGHVFSLSAGDVAAMSARALGFKSVAKVEQMVRMRRFTLVTLLWRLKRASGRLGAYKFIRPRVRGMMADHPGLFASRSSQLKRLDEVAGKGGLGLGLEATAVLRAEAMVTLIARLGHTGKIRQVRDASYLRWRYASPPRDYRFIYSGGSELDGYLVLSTTRGDLFPAVRIVDWEGPPEVKRRMLRAAIKAGRFRQTATWTFGSSESDLAILRNAGLSPERLPKGVKGQGISVFVKVLGDGGDRLGNVPVLAPGSWDYRMIYSDFA
jgi:hypothetical protein